MLTSSPFLTSHLLPCSSQYFDVKIVLPKQITYMMLKGHLNWANETQEEYRRNGREVDKETYLALAEVMESRRGKPLMSEQEVSEWEGSAGGEGGA